MKELPQRFMAKVAHDELTGCWNWTGHVTEFGYAVFSYQGRPNRAHRFSYQMTFGDIPDGKCLDHLCRNRKCVNPFHLEPVTNAENSRRGLTGLYSAVRQLSKTHCPKGHPYAGANLIERSNGSRGCRECSRERSRIHYEKRKAGMILDPHNSEKSHCKRNHEFTEENTILIPGGRSCRQCARMRGKQSYRRRKERGQ